MKRSLTKLKVLVLQFVICVTLIISVCDQIACIEYQPLDGKSANGLIDEGHFAGPTDGGGSVIGNG